MLSRLFLLFAALAGAGRVWKRLRRDNVRTCGGLQCYGNAGARTAASLLQQAFSQAPRVVRGKIRKLKPRGRCVIAG